MRYIFLLFFSLAATNFIYGQQTFTNNTRINAPVIGNTSGVGSPYPSNINVSGVLGSVTKVTVTLTSFSHTFPDDLDILLVGPTGAKMLLMSDTGGSLDINNITLTFDDAAAGNLPDSTQMSTGTFRPTNIGAGDVFPAPAPAAPYGSTLAGFNGLNPNGTWSLYVVDDTSGDSGAIANGWSLTIQTAPTAAGISIGGRVLTEGGRGIYGARIQMTDSNGETRTVNSNPFGYYRFTDVPVGETYIINVLHKLYQFSPQLVAPSDEISDFDITAQP